MEFSFLLLINSIGLGVALAMDAFSVSIANGLAEPDMKKNKVFGVAGTYAFFQFAMPMIGWFCVHTIVSYFKKVQPFIPYIALALLLFIGGKMIIDYFKEKKEQGNEEAEVNASVLTFGTLMVQGVATSIDALSVGFTIENYAFPTALVACIIIAVVTMAICLVGLLLGKKIGNKFAWAQVLGGGILIAIGLEIFIKGVFLV